MPEARPRRVAVVGASGFIGSNLVDLLVDRGVDTVAIAHARHQMSPPESVTVVQLEIDTVDELAEAFDEATHVVHLAARSGGIQLQESVDRAIFDYNRRLTDTVLTAAETAGVRRVFLASSAVVYRDVEATQTPEDAPVLVPSDHPSGYAWSKITDEVVAGWWNRNTDLETVIGRFGNVYGPGASFDPERSTVIHALIRRIATAEDGAEIEVWGDGTAVRSFIHVRDVAAAILMILTRGDPGDAYNVDTGQAVSIAELAHLIRDNANPSVSLRFDDTKPVGVARRVPDPSRLIGLGFSPGSTLTTGLKETIAWHNAVYP